MAAGIRSPDANLPTFKPFFTTHIFRIKQLNRIDNFSHLFFLLNIGREEMIWYTYCELGSITYHFPALNNDSDFTLQGCFAEQSFFDFHNSY